MAKKCPQRNGVTVIYLDCMDCPDKKKRREIEKELFVKKNIKKKS